jgi:hypothetical protein
LKKIDGIEIREKISNFLLAAGLSVLFGTAYLIISGIIPAIISGGIAYFFFSLLTKSMEIAIGSGVGFFALIMVLSYVLLRRFEEKRKILP